MDTYDEQEAYDEKIINQKLIFWFSIFGSGKNKEVS